MTSTTNDLVEIQERGIGSRLSKDGLSCLQVQSKTLRSKPQTVLPSTSSVASAVAQNALKARSKTRVPQDPNSVASIQRQLDPLAFDPIVKKLTN